MKPLPFVCPLTRTDLRRVEREALLGIVEDPSWMHAESTALFPDNVEKAQSFYEQIKSVYERRAKLAGEKLPAMLDLEDGAPLDALRAAFEKLEERDLPPQLLPAGWFPDATQSGRFRI